MSGPTADPRPTAPRPLVLLTALALATTLLPGVARAAATTFTVGAGGTDGRQRVVVQSSTSVEDFTGVTDVLSGSVTFDPEARLGGAELVVDGTTIDTGNRMRNGHMISGAWLDFATHPEVRFVSTAVEHLEGDRYLVTGELTLSGETREVEAEAVVRYLPASAETEAAGFEGSIVAVEASFEISLSEFDVPNPRPERVADTLALTVTLFASDAR